MGDSIHFAGYSKTIDSKKSRRTSRFNDEKPLLDPPTAPEHGVLDIEKLNRLTDEVLSERTKKQMKQHLESKLIKTQENSTLDLSQATETLPHPFSAQLHNTFIQAIESCYVRSTNSSSPVDNYPFDGKTNAKHTGRRSTMIDVTTVKGIQSMIPRYRATAVQMRDNRIKRNEILARTATQQQPPEPKKDDVFDSLMQFVMESREDDCRIAQSISEQLETTGHKEHERRGKSSGAVPGQASIVNGSNNDVQHHILTAPLHQPNDNIQPNKHYEKPTHKPSLMAVYSLSGLLQSPGHFLDEKPSPKTKDALIAITSAAFAAAVRSMPPIIRRTLMLHPIMRTKNEVELVFAKLRSFKFKAFERFSDYTLNELCKVAGWEFMPAKTVVFNQGEVGTKWYVIMGGEVDLFVTPVKTANKLDTIKVASLKLGDSFGDLALISNSPRLATVVCVGNCEFITVEKADYIRTAQFIHQLDLKDKTQFLRSLPIWDVDSGRPKIESKAPYKTFSTVAVQSSLASPINASKTESQSRLNTSNSPSSAIKPHVFSLNTIQSLAGVITWQHFPPGANIITEGQSCTQFYIIKTGRCLVYRGIDLPTNLVQKFEQQLIIASKGDACTIESKEKRDAAIAELLAFVDRKSKKTQTVQRYQVQVAIKEPKEYFNEEWVVKFGIGDYLSLWVRDTIDMETLKRGNQVNAEGSSTNPTVTVPILADTILPVTSAPIANDEQITSIPVTSQPSTQLASTQPAPTQPTPTQLASIQPSTQSSARIPEFNSIITVKAHPDDPKGVEVAVMSIYDGQTKIRNEIHSSKYYYLDNRQLAVMWLAERLSQEWKATRKHVLKQQRLYSKTMS